MALTKVRGKGLGTLGDGTANDTSIVFDGNAQDFHVGLDDSTDSLTIGLGSTLGTTSHMVFDANGHITKPLQSAFLARKSSDTQNLNYDTYHTVIFDTETFDQNGDYNNSTGIFTAPVTGRYQLNVLVYLQEIPSNAGYVYAQLACSNNAAFHIMDTAPLDDATPYKTLPLSILMDMDANDTAKVFVYIQGGSTTIDIDGGTENNTSFSGFLVA